MNVVNVKHLINVIRKNKVPIRFTKAEGMALARLLTGNVVTGSVAEAGAWDKLKEGFKKALKKVGKAILPLLILAPSAHGLTIKTPDKYAQTMEQIAEEDLGVDIEIKVKETKRGGAQMLKFTITYPDDPDSKAVINFLGTESNTMNDLKLKVTKNADIHFDAFVKTWFETMQERMLDK